jgi:hypothetical protein
MPRLLNILLGFALLLSFAMGGVAHAAERVCLPSTEAAAEAHTQGDSDQSPHGDSGPAHHHGSCHGHHVAAPAESHEAETTLAGRLEVTETGSILGAAVPPGANLRPPIA